MFIFGQRHLQVVLKEYIAYFNHRRPHQGLDQHIPVPLPVDHRASPVIGRGVRPIPILHGLHRDYQLAA
jgi:putative transposase